MDADLTPLNDSILVDVLEARYTQYEGIIDYRVVINRGNNKEEHWFTLVPGDEYLLGPAMQRWIDSHPDFPIGPAPELPLPTLSAYNFRMMLTQAGVKFNTILNNIAGFPDQSMKQQLQTHFEYSTEFTWDEDLTQAILGLAELDESKLKAAWRAKAQEV